MSLAEDILAATKAKPDPGQPCNRCGWCCLTEVCPTGQLFYGESIPCKGLIKEGLNYSCRIANTDYIFREELAIGTGCDSITQKEAIEGWRVEDV